MICKLCHKTVEEVFEIFVLEQTDLLHIVACEDCMRVRITRFQQKAMAGRN